MKKVISFSLWGNDPKYCQGAIRNAELAAEIYPGWECHFHVDCKVPSAVLVALGSLDNTRVIFRLDADQPYIDKTPNVAIGDWRGMFWRFEMTEDTDVLISRDCDSRLSLREKAAVDQWLAGDKGFHIMRDHPWHGAKILGGMWGMKKDSLPEFLDLMLSWKQEDRWQTDQDFLAAEIYPRVVTDACVHDEFFKPHPLEDTLPFPTHREGLEFVGSTFDENEQSVEEHLRALQQAL